jgi:hypothetical protein
MSKPVADPHRPHLVRVTRDVYGAYWWCLRTLGDPGPTRHLWRSAGANFYFKHQSDAIAFRLVWVDNEQHN